MPPAPPEPPEVEPPHAASETGSSAEAQNAHLPNALTMPNGYRTSLPAVKEWARVVVGLVASRSS
jgi:hypothetical protein